jgi:hypothetical protein
MATRDEIFDRFITPMERRLGVPKGRDATAFYEDVVGELGDISPDALEPARLWFRRHWEANYWPVPAKIRKVALQVNKGQVVEDKRTEPEKRDLTHDEVMRVLHCDLGRQAARERWIGDLYDYVQANHRLPGDAFKIRRMASRGGRNDQLIRDLEADQVFNENMGRVVSIPNHVRLGLIDMGRKMQARDDETSLHIGVTPPVHTTQVAS